MEHDWTKVHERLSTLDAEALVRIAIEASTAVQAEWKRETPRASHALLIEVAAALDSWVATGEIHARIKDIAAAAYATLGASELPGSPARRSGLAVAHAAFALYFWSLRNKEKVFSLRLLFLALEITAIANSGITDARPNPRQAGRQSVDANPGYE